MSDQEILARIPLTAKRLAVVGEGEAVVRQGYAARNPAAQFVSREDIASLPDHSLDCSLWLGILGRIQRPEQWLAKLRGLTRQGGICQVVIDNYCHWSLVFEQLRGNWPLDKASSAAPQVMLAKERVYQMLQDAGWTLLEPEPLGTDDVADERAQALFGPLAQGLGLDGDAVRKATSPRQWLVSAINGPAPSKLHIAALALQKMAGVNEARIDYPLTALASQPDCTVVWGSGNVQIPRSWPPGIFILHRQFMDRKDLNDHVERMIGRGWMIVAEMDDDPRHWQQYIDSNFLAFRGVHAVTVSTEPLRALIRQWNPYIQVFPNAIPSLPTVSPRLPKSGDKLRIFFGALNRGNDWGPIRQAIMTAATRLADKVAFVVVHDQDFFNALPEGVDKEFHPTLSHSDYMAVLAGCDLSLLPLADTGFNRLKSDLKFIESCAAGAVPCCSPVVYGEQSVHKEIGYFADSPEQWFDLLIAACGNWAELAQRRRLGLDYVKSRRMHGHQVVDRMAFYRSLLANRERLEQERRGRLAGKLLSDFTV